MPEKGRSDTRIVKVRRGRKTYEIPVDQDGFVPMLALIERFQEQQRLVPEVVEEFVFEFGHICGVVGPFADRFLFRQRSY